MCQKLALLLSVLSLQALLGSVEGKSFFGVGQRILGDDLLVRDEQHSRPAGLSEPPSVVFNYEIPEPITYIEIISEENILAEVKFSYLDQLVVGMVTVLPPNSQDIVEDNDANSTTRHVAFDVVISIYGYNHTMLNVNPALLLNRDQQFEGFMKSDTDDTDEAIESNELSESYDNAERDVLEVDIDEAPHVELPYEVEELLAGHGDDFEAKDKIIEVGKRQNGDHLIYETYQTSPDHTEGHPNQSIIFYYIDSDYITYVKFVIFDYFANRPHNGSDYKPPLAEYTHFSPNTLKAVITDFNSSSLFVQMFIYGYWSKELPKSYVPFLPPPHWARTDLGSLLTPMQRVQLLLLTGKSTVAPATGDDDDDDGEDEKPVTIGAKDMELDHQPVLQSRTSDMSVDVPSAALEQLDQRLWAFVAVLLLLLHSN